MFSLRKYLADYLIELNKQQQVAQSIRESLSLNPYFQIISVFDRLDKFRKGYVEPSDLSQFMLENQIYPTETQLYIIFRDFDIHQKGVLNIHDLQAQLLPNHNHKLTKNCLSKQPYPVQLKLELDLEFLLAKYFQHKINTVIILAQLQNKIKQVKPLVFKEAFQLIKSKHSENIDSQLDIDNFLRQNGKQLDREQLERIFQALNLNKSSKISFSTFCKHIDPIGSGFYPAYSLKLADKKHVQNLYLSRKYEVNSLKTQNLVQRQQLNCKISQLRDSNSRLRGIISQQNVAKRHQTLSYPSHYF